MRVPYSREYDPPAPVIEVTVKPPKGKGVRVKALIDSGADISVFPRELLRELKLVPGSLVKVQGYDGSIEEIYSYFIEVDFKGIVKDIVEAVPGEHMLLGRNFLRLVNVTLRGKENELEIVDP